jgi:hypothetical protein
MKKRREQGKCEDKGHREHTKRRQGEVKKSYEIGEDKINENIIFTLSVNMYGSEKHHCAKTGLSRLGSERDASARFSFTIRFLH